MQTAQMRNSGSNDTSTGPDSSWLESVVFGHLPDMLPDTPVLVHEISPQAKIRYANDAACRHFGMGREELLRTSPLDLDLNLAQAAAVDSQPGKNGAIAFETRHRTASGETVLVAVQTKITSHEGRRFGISLLRRLKEAEPDLQQPDSWCSPSSFESCLPGFLFVCRLRDGRLSVPYLSPALREFYGTPPAPDRLAAESGAAEMEMADLLPAGVPLADASAVEDAFRRLAAPGETLVADYRHIHPDAGERWMRLRANPRVEGDGNVLWHGFIYDNTGHKRMEETLRSREQEFHTLAENSPDVVVRYDRDCRRLYANPAWAQINGIPLEDVLGKSPQELAGVVAPYAQEFQTQLRRVIEGGQPANIELHKDDDDGRTRHLDMRAVPEFDADGRVESILTVTRDVSEQKRLQAVLAAREQEFRSLAESSPDNIIRYDLDDRIRYLNANLIRFLGLDSAKEVLGKRPREAWPDGRFAAIEAASARARASGESQRVELVVPVGAGKTDYHLLQVVAERDAAGSIVGTLAFGRDITAIRETEMRLRHFVDNLPGVAFTFRLSADGSANFPFVSSAIHNLYGLDPEMFKVKDIVRELPHPDDRPIIKAAIAASARTLSTFHVETRFCRPGLPEIWIDLRAEPTLQPDGAVLWYGLMFDITERKQAEEALGASERKFRTLAEGMPDNLMRFDRQCRLQYMNPAMRTSLAPEVLMPLGKSHTEAFPGVDSALEHQRQLERLMETGEEGELEVRLPNPQGEMRTHHVRYVAERDEHGEIVGALSIGRDITEHKQAEALLVQREREFRSLAENLPDAIFRYDHAGRRIYVNPVVERLAGQPCKALVGKLPTEAALNPAIDSAKAQRYVMEVLETGERRVFETAFVAADGRQAFFHLVIVPEFAADGSVGGALGIGHDISPLKQMEDTLRERQAFLDSLLEAIPAPVFYQDRQGRYLGFNRAFGEFFGVSEEYLVGRSVFDICPRDIAEAYHAKDEELFAQGGVQRYESRVKSTQSELRDVVFHKATFAGTGNEAGGLIGVVLDISEHKRLEEALGLREQEFRSLAESSPDSIIRYDQKGHIRYLNSKLEHNLGRTLAELEGLQPCEAWPDGRFAEIEGAMWRAIREGEVTTVVLRAAINTPESRYQQIRVVPERDAAGRIVGALAFGSDVTEIFSLQAAIAAREQEFHSLAESYPDNIIRVDREHRIRYLNRAMARSMKLDDAGELLGKRHDEAFSDLRFQPIHEAEERAMTSGEEQVVELSVPLDDGSHAHHLLSVVPELDTAGKVIGAITVGRDITERKRMEEELRRTAAFQKQLLDGLRDVGIWQLVIEGGKIIYHNDTHLGAVLGYTAEDLDASPDFLDLVHPDDKPRVIERYRQHLAGDAAPGSFELGVLAKDGSRREFLIYSCVISDSNPPRALTLSMDITERKRMEDEVRLREQQFRALVENSPDTIARYDHNCRCIYANPALMASFAQWPNDLLGAMPSRFIGGESGLRYEEKIREILTNGVAADFELAWRQSGEVVHTLVRIAPEHGRDGKVLGVLAVGRDITELAEQREKIHNLAFFDFVTGLANRALFHDRLYHAIADARWHDTLLGVILLDLDRFKTVNDTLGHDVGDALLREAAARLSGCVRDYDTVARLGGDEFAILLPEIRDAQSLSTVADKILNELGKPFLLGGKEVFIGASIGIATYPSDCEDADGLLKFADLAMYAAKSAGGNGFRYYSAGLTVRAHERMKIETELRYALERGEFELYFQPKVRLADGCMTGSEALLRWNSPKFGMVTPDRFIGIAEDTGMIVGIGAWVLREACHAASAWNAAGGLPHKVAVNLSPRQFGDGGLERNVTQALKETGCRAEWIELEITESLLLNTTEEVRRMLETLRAGGFSIAIDDFGTGYSSLSYLTNLPIDVLKIDRSFVKDMLTNPDKAELVKAIIAMAGALRMNLVAEGVETEEQAQLLLKHGCAVGQGYLYGKPMPKCEVENYSPSETDHLRTEQHTIAESRARQPTATTRLT